jgi:hypothetical protein
MSGSGNDKITNVLGASTASAAASGVLGAQNAQRSWIILTLSITAGLALLAFVLKVVALAIEKRAK